MRDTFLRDPSTAALMVTIVPEFSAALAFSAFGVVDTHHLQMCHLGDLLGTLGRKPTLSVYQSG